MTKKKETKEKTKTKEKLATEIQISEIDGQLILEEGKELYTGMLESKQEIDLMLQEMTKQRNILQQMIGSIDTELRSAIKEQEKANLVLRKIPENIEHKMEKIVPKVAEELDKVYEGKIEKYSEMTLDCINKLDDLRNATTSFEAGQKRKFFFSLIATFILAASTAVGGTFLVLEYHPNHVQFNGVKDVIIKQSDVIVWGADKVLNKNKKQR